MKAIPDWAREAKKVMIDRDMTVTALADELGKSRVYISSVLNGRVICQSVQAKICGYLNIRVAS